ncbi:MAG: F0F1 ATP synthase subunit B [Planctomycetota bacterium]
MGFSLQLLAAGGLVPSSSQELLTIVWAWVAFLVTLWALSKVAWPMLARKMEEREIRIKEGLAKAEEAERRAQELLRTQEAVLAEAREEAGKVIAETRAAAANMRQDAISAAQKEIAAERDRAKKEIELERAKAVDELRRAAVDLTLEAAGRVLERSLTDADHRRLAAEVIGKVDVLR